MASVAMLRFWSLIRPSISMLQLITAIGCVIATCKAGVTSRLNIAERRQQAQYDHCYYRAQIKYTIAICIDVSLLKLLPDVLKGKAARQPGMHPCGWAEILQLGGHACVEVGAQSFKRRERICNAETALRQEEQGKYTCKASILFTDDCKTDGLQACK